MWGRGLFLIALFLASNSSFAKTDIEFILDASGSMRAKMAGSTQMDVAKQAIKTSLESLPADAFVALRVYAHRVPQTDKKNSCVDSELLIPFGALNKSDFSAKVDSIQPKGYTPIAYSLEQAANDFGVERESEHVLVLVSDGEETCGGDPVAVVKKLAELGFKVKVHAVGFNVDPKAQAQLTEIAKAGGGQYYDARDPVSLSGTLKKITEDTFLIKKTTTIYGSEIRGGDSYETAVPLQANKMFHLDHHQRKNEFDYFAIEVKSGQRIVLTTQTGQQGVEISGNNAAVNERPCSGIALFDNQRQQLSREDIYAGQNAKKSFSWNVPHENAGTFYVLVGSVQCDQHKDSPFEVDLVDQFDVNADRDSGADQASAIEIPPGNYEKSYLGRLDNTDTLKVNLTAGTYQFQARTVSYDKADAFPGKLTITLRDSDGVALADATSPDAGATAKIENLKILKDGPVFVTVVDYWGNTKGGAGNLTYSLSIVSGEAAEQTPIAQQPPIAAPQTNPPATNPAPTSISLMDTFKQLSFGQKAQWILLCFLVPWIIVFSIGALFGYLVGKNRR